MKTSIAVLLVIAAGSWGCGHATLTSATYFREGAIPTLNPAATAGPNHLVLQITRRLDTILTGPDIDEDQRLILDLRNVRLQQRLPIPSAEAVPQLLVTRFGPSSVGKEFRGFVIIKNVSTNQVDATLHLDVVARTDNGSYTQNVQFRGDFKFFRQIPVKDFGK